MKVLNFGSLNYDNVYSMEHFVQPGETESSESCSRGFGGKGLNQSIALAKAGADVYHAGKVGFDGQPFIDYLNEYHVNTSCLIKDEAVPTGHAIIQVSHAENCIILFGGANQAITEAEIDAVLSNFTQGDVLLLQNEINNMPYLMKQAYAKSMRIVFNTAPMNEKVYTYPLELVTLFIVNETEGKGLAGVQEGSYEEVLDVLTTKYPASSFVMTVGKDGSWYADMSQRIYQKAFPVKAVDTTAAGDTFTGYYLAWRLEGHDPGTSMKAAALASSLTVQKEGAAKSIPERSMVEELLKEN